ncbi:MAG TPA: hypothetical protein VK116_17985, partial [Planctomycetota bacterium]|nr:hypothetical protein [Planctomycetota bacterium]
MFVLEDIGVSRGEPRPAFVDNRRQTIELINDALIARGELRGADQDLEGAIDVDELLLTFLRHTEQEFEALSGIFQSRKLTLADVEQLLPATGRLVERLEHLADAQHFRAGREQVFECAEGTFMLRRGREDFPVDFDRSEDVAELLLLQLAQAILEAQDLVGGVAEVRLRNQDLGEFLVL